MGTTCRGRALPLALLLALLPGGGAGGAETTRVFARVCSVDVSKGERLYVLGKHPALGGEQTEKALPMHLLANDGDTHMSTGGDGAKGGDAEVPPLQRWGVKVCAAGMQREMDLKYLIARAVSRAAMDLKYLIAKEGSLATARTLRLIPAEVAPGLLVGGGYPTTLLEIRALKRLG
ncbi:hypothetical protein T484DRAFT_1828163, partial [Baffinella frigidus]